MNKRYFRTRLTDLLEIDHPMMLGGMMHLSDASMVAAVVNAGVMGFITARSFPTVETFRDELRKCARLTEGKRFGVNLTLSRRMGFDTSIQALLETALEEGVRLFETAGVLPKEIIGPVHSAGGKLIHKCPRIRHALAAQRLGVDAVTLVGMDEGGHPGRNELPSMIQAAYAKDRIHIPLAVGGGIGHGRQIASALALGLDGVCMGSRMMVATEVTAHENYKRRLVEVDEDCSTTALASLGDTWRVLVNENVREVQRIEAAGARTHEEFGELIRGYRTKQFAYEAGDWQIGMLSCSSAAGFADKIEPAAAIIERLMCDAAAALDEAASHRIAAKPARLAC
jgi:NADH:quinone reductase (non-electrogenic)